MKVTKRQLRQIIEEQTATVSTDTIEDVVMGVLSDEGGAAGVDPIEDALENLEDDAISLPDEDIEDIIGDVTGVKRHADGDYIDTTQLEGKSMKLTKRQLRRIIKEESAKLITERQQQLPNLRNVLMNSYEMLYDDMTLSASGEELANVEEEVVKIIMGEVDAFLDSVGMRGKLGRSY